MTDQQQGFTMMLAEDRKTVRLELPPTLTLTALELERIMRDLAWMRANMLPAAPDEDPRPDTMMSVVPATRWYVSQDEMPTQVRLSVMHLGFGWLWIPLSADATKRLADTLLRVLRNLPKLQ